MLFAAGHLVGELARVRYPSGVLVAEGPKEIDQAIERTATLIDSAVQQPIFEAAFRRDNVVIRADIIEPDGWGGWTLIEVKNARAVREYQRRDAATQHWVITGNRLCLSSVIIRHVERPLRSERDLLRTRFVDADVTAEVQAISANRKRVVDAANAIACAPEPDIAPGPHCVRPFRCEFREHCAAHSAGSA